MVMLTEIDKVLEQNGDLTNFDKLDIINSLKKYYVESLINSDIRDRYDRVIVDSGKMIGVDLSDEPRYKWLKIALSDHVDRYNKLIKELNDNGIEIPFETDMDDV